MEFILELSNVKTLLKIGDFELHNVMVKNNDKI